MNFLKSLNRRLTEAFRKDGIGVNHETAIVAVDNEITLPVEQEKSHDYSGTKIKNSRHDVPVFGRNYEFQLTREVRVELTAKNDRFLSSSTRRRWSGYLWQRNGNLVSFDPERIADKILDRDLVPLIQDFVDAIVTIDAEWLEQNNHSFVDESGVTWARVD